MHLHNAACVASAGDIGRDGVALDIDKNGAQYDNAHGKTLHGSDNFEQSISYSAKKEKRKADRPVGSARLSREKREWRANEINP